MAFRFFTCKARWEGPTGDTMARTTRCRFPKNHSGDIHDDGHGNIWLDHERGTTNYYDYYLAHNLGKLK